MKITVGESTITVPDGSNVSVVDGVITVNGSVWDAGKFNATAPVVVQITGDAGDVLSSGSIKVKGSCRDVKADASVDCGSVSGSVTAGSSVKCLDVGQNVTAGSSVNCGNVGGKVRAGSSINYRK